MTYIQHIIVKFNVLTDTINANKKVHNLESFFLHCFFNVPFHLSKREIFFSNTKTELVTTPHNFFGVHELA